LYFIGLICNEIDYRKYSLKILNQLLSSLEISGDALAGYFSETATQPKPTAKVHFLSDEHIMMKVCQGHLEQLGLLFERYHGKLYNFFLRTTADKDLSRDLTQNVFERILKYSHTYKEDSPFKAWFYQIARNVKTDHFKKIRFQTSSLEEVKAERNLGLSEEGHRGLEQAERIKLLHEALNMLPEDKREILVLSQLEEMEYKQIAEIYNITENLARVKVHRALKSLKEVFLKIGR
jgi:RNA polymerase sigma factor (sigma-70 family)